MKMIKYVDQAKEVLNNMTLKEKAQLCSGSDFWHTKGVERLGIEKIMVTDGPHGLRKQASQSDHLGINQSVPATCFPTAATTACSFDTELLHEIGGALGEECLQEGVSVLLGPGANIKRSPLCGRNFEYFSEDPHLTGEMAAALIKGIQEKGIGTSLKHFAANNQETQRLVVDGIIDERALHEIYLPGFERAIKEAAPWTVMCSYNKINGVYSSENKWLLTDLLRTAWGFEGIVVTDWGAVVDRVEGIKAGLDLEMPYTGPENDEAIVAAVECGKLQEEELNTVVLRMLMLLLACADNKKDGYHYNASTHHQLARKAATSSAVLLKNEESLLPLGKNQKLAVLGQFAKKPRYQGAGSSKINPIQLDNLCDVLCDRGIDYTYSPGYNSRSDVPEEGLLQEAQEVAQKAEVCIVCIGLPDSYESEGFDRTHLRLPESHIALLEKVQEVNQNVVVLLFTGGVVEMPWLEKAKALLLLYLGGQAGAQAAVDILYGDVCPSGKLAESFPHKLADTPSYKYFPGENKRVEYRESIYVGYRFYDKANVDVLFPFGYGLSYTNFDYSNLVLSQSEETITASVCIKNIGSVAGEEIVQFYVEPVSPSVHRPLRELKGFSKVFLQPGEEKEVVVVLDKRAFAFYATNKKDWCVEAGDYIICAAASSRNIRCTQIVTLTGDRVDTVPSPTPYRAPSVPFCISDEAFEKALGYRLDETLLDVEKKYTINTTVGEIMGTKEGQGLIAKMKHIADGSNEEEDDDIGVMFQRMFNDLPLRGMKLFSGGAITLQEIEEVLDKLNKDRYDKEAIQ